MLKKAKKNMKNEKFIFKKIYFYFKPTHKNEMKLYMFDGINIDEH